MLVDDIISSIGDDVEVGTRPLDPRFSNLGRVNAAGTEDNVPGEGTIFYDIRFTAYIKDEKMKILLNVEAQRSSNTKKLGYPAKPKDIPEQTDRHAGNAPVPKGYRHQKKQILTSEYGMVMTAELEGEYRPCAIYQIALLKKNA